MSSMAMERSATRGDLRRQFERATALLRRFPDSLLLAAARAGVGLVFLKSGLTKIDNFDSTIELFASEYKVPLLPPDIAAYLGTATELVAPVLLFLGLGARFGAAALLGMTLVIQSFVYPLNYAEHLTWAALLLPVIARGAGGLSLDALLRRRLLG